MMFGQTRRFLELIKFEHTVFALPFAYLGYLLGSRGAIDLLEVAWITLAMVSARTAGMGLNRMVDRSIDGRNPRTQGRASVTGQVSMRVLGFVSLICLVLFIFSASQLNSLCLKLTPLALVLLVGYHYLKRFTAACHFGIGLVLACAPLGGWIAATGRWETAAGCLGLAVMFWVAGFDIFYSLQDRNFDAREGLFSIPSKLGIEKAVQIARLCHFFTLFFLIQLGIIFPIGLIYWFGLAVSGCILTFEHVLMRNGEIKNSGMAFFTLNGLLSIVFFMITLISLAFKSGISMA